MELLIFSDSHGKADAMEYALSRQIRRPQAILFLGDGLRDVESLCTGGADLYAVRGNCDWYGYDQYPTELVVELAGYRLFCTHGHLYSAKSGVGGLLRRAAELDVDAVLFGHTHEPYLETLVAGTVIGDHTLKRRLYLFNPGSVGAWKGTFGTLSLTDSGLLFSHGRRG